MGDSFKVDPFSDLNKTVNLNDFFKKNTSSFRLEFFKNISNLFPLEAPSQMHPLETSKDQRNGFEVNVISAIFSMINGNSSSVWSGACLAFQSVFFVYNFFQNPSQNSSYPLGSLESQIVPDFTPLKPMLPYLNCIIYAKAAYEMGKDLWQKIDISFDQQNEKSYIKVAKNLIIYGVNGLFSGYSFYDGFQNVFLQKRDIIEESKKILCKGASACPSDWTVEEVKKLYRKQALSFHPDKNKKFEEDFISLTRAKDILLTSFEENSLVTEMFFKQSRQQEKDDLLDEIGISKDLITLTNREFAHVLGDPYIKGTNLQGMDEKSVRQLLSKLSQNLTLPFREKIEKFLESIYQVYSPMTESEIITMSKDVAQKVKNLRVEEDFWLLGGWDSSGIDGHRLLYRWIKRTEKSFDIYIYNLGKGIQYHDEQVRKDPIHSSQIVDSQIEEAISDKTYYSPFVKFTEVSGDEIGLYEGKELDPFLFNKLITLFQNDGSVDRSDEIYFEIFKPLNHKRMRNPILEMDDILTVPHRSGTCGWFSVAHAAFRGVFFNEDEWNKLYFQRNQIAFHSHCPTSLKSSLDAERKELCLQGGRSLLLQLSELLETLFSPTEVEKYRRPIQKVLDVLNPRPSSIVLKESPPLSYIGQSKLFPSDIVWRPDTPHNKESQQIIPFPAVFLNLEKMDNLIAELQNILNFKGQDLPYDIPMQIERLVKALPRPSTFEKLWLEADKNQIKQAINSFSRVFKLYASKTLPREGRLLEEQNTAWALLAIIYHLSGRIHEDLRLNYGVFYQSFADLIKNPLFTSFHREDLKFYKELVSYFMGTPQKNLLFQIPSAKGVWIEDGYSVRSPDVDLLNSIALSNPNIFKKLEEEDRKWKERRTKEYQAYQDVASEKTRSFYLRLQDNLFSYDSEYDYIAFLRRACYLAQGFTKELFKGKFNPETFYINRWHYTINGWYLANFWIKDDLHLVPDQNNAFSNLHIDKPDEHVCFLNPNSEGKENQAILKNNNIPYRLESVACEKELQSELLVNYYKDKLFEFSDVKNQNIFLLTLFKSYHSLDSTKSYNSLNPIYEAIQNPVFIDSVSELIENGLNFFCYAREKPDIKTTLFFLQVVRRLKEIDPSLNLRDYNSEINKLLEINGLTDEEVQMLHMHRILQYTTEKNRLNSLNKNETKGDKALKDILISWIYLNSYKFNSWHAIHSKSEAVRFIYDLAPVFENLSLEFVDDLINEILPTQSEVGKAYTCENSSSLYNLKRRLSNGLDQVWSFNILHGKILCDGKIPIFGVQEDFTQYPSYKRLFGNQRFLFKVKDGAFVFHDSLGKKFRLFKEGLELIVQMEVEGEWYQYLTGNENDFSIEKFHSKVPKSLIADHFIFRSSKATLFLHKDTFSIDFIDFKDALSVKKASLQQGVDKKFYETIGKFEGKSWLLERKFNDGSVEIQLPRFRSLRGNHLGFVQTDLGLAWNEDLRFILKQHQSGLLGLCSNYLFLEDGITSKLLVPCKPVALSTEFAPHCKLDIEDERRKSEYLNNALSKLYDGELNSPQEKNYFFVEYDIKEGQIRPLNQEGTLFLSYLFLAQKEYEKALELWKDVFYLKNDVMLSDDSNKILSWIFDYTKWEESYDISPSAIALSLRAAIILFKNKKLNNLIQVDNLWRRYQETLDRVSSKMRLTMPERKKIQEIIGSMEMQQKRDIWCSFEENKMNHDREVEKFLKVYNDFQKAKTQEEKVFLNIKHFNYLTKTQGVFSEALNAVRLTNNAPLLEFSDIPFSDKNKQFFQRNSGRSITSNSADILLMGCSNSNKNVPKARKVKTPERSQAQSLYKIKGEIGAPFTLPSIELPQESVLGSIAQDFLMKTEVSIQRNSVSLEGFLKKPVLPLYESAIEKERASFLEEYKIGVEKNKQDQEVRWDFKKDRETLHKRLQNYLVSETPRLQNLRREILHLANRLPEDSSKKTLSLLLIEGQAKSKASLPDVIQCFLEGKAEVYWALNSHLTQEEIKKLDQLVGNFLRSSIEFSQGKKALKTQNLQELAEILSNKTVYVSSEYESFRRQFLVYEYRSGFKMRKEQVELIQKMALEKKSVTQLMMGGGKTSVLASNLLYFAAKPGRIAFFIGPQAQFSTLKENLSNMQRKHFDQEVIPIQLKRNQINIESLEKIKFELNRAKTLRKVILTTRETIELLNLEFLDSLNQEVENKKKVELLFFLLKEMKNFGDVLVDEVDLILNPMQEMNFPIGAKKMIQRELVDMTRQLFSMITNRAFEWKIELRANRQAFMSESDRLETFNKIVDQFSTQYKDGNLVLLGKEKGALFKHLLADVLPLTLSKSTGESYGRVLDQDVVGPYYGVGSPTFSEFGSPWEAMVYHFQTALSTGVTRSQIKNLYDSFFAVAKHNALTQKKSIESTEEANVFRELTGCTLSEFSDPAYMQRAIDRVNKNPKAQLLIEADTIAQLVGYYPYYLRSTSQNFVSSFSGFDSFSGTPWNVESFPQLLRDHFYPDVGTEGRIADLFLQKAQEESLQIHVIKGVRPNEVLSDVLEKLPLKKQSRISGFIDAGGLLKEGSRISIARGILDFYANDNRIQTVLFFDRATPSSPETLMALRKGDEKPVIIGSTQPDEIARLGISLDSTFVYYDQTHCEATDIVQKEDAINIISINHQMTSRTLFQGLLRLRSYFKGQNVEVIMLKDNIPHFSDDPQKIPTYEDVLLKLVDNQAVRKADQTFRAYKQKIDHVLTELVMEKLLSLKYNVPDTDVFNQYRNILVHEKEEGLYAQFGSPEVFIDSLQSLIDYSNQKFIFFKSLTQDKTLINIVRERLDEIISSASQCSYLPEKTKRLLEDGLGKEQEIAQEVELEIDQALTKELQLELDSHQIKGSDEPFNEISWTEKDLIEFSEGVISKKSHLNKLKDVLSEKIYVKFGKKYSDLFKDEFFVSNNFISVRKGLNSIFDKRSRYAGQILVIQKEGKSKVLLISTAEAKKFRDYIKKKSPNNIFLITPDGRPFTGKAPEMTEELKDLLWQVNLFNGNINALIEDPITYQKKDQLKPETLYDFLALKADSEQRALLFYFSPNQKERDFLSSWRGALYKTAGRLFSLFSKSLLFKRRNQSSSVS